MSTDWGEYELSSEEEIPKITSGIGELLSSMLGTQAEEELSSDPPLSRSTHGSAGYDLSSLHTLVITPHTTVLVNTGIKLTLPDGYYAQILDRSSITLHRSAKNGSGVRFTNSSIITLAGVIDSDYKGEVGVVLHNLGNYDFKINAGDKIAQLVIHKIYKFDNELQPIKDASFEHTGYGSTN